MNVEDLVALRAKRRITLLGRGIAVAALIVVASPATAADGSSPAEKSKAVSFEAIPGSKVKRVVLAAKAAERLGIEMGRVEEGAIVRKQIVGGIFVAPSLVSPALTAAAPPTEGASGSVFTTVTLQRSALTPPAIGEGLVRVMFSPQEWDRIAKDQPARVFRLAPRGSVDAGVLAMPSGIPPAEDSKRSMLTYFYVVDGKDHGIAANERVRVELQLIDDGETRKIVPYSAVYYDAKGGAWVYLMPRPLTYERTPVKLEYIIGDKAALLEGPEVGTEVVAVGVALLYGAEVYGK